ncbi:hypothetical protein MAPG_05487 [Magnaporthiopsis poae ATCC 64411]|uniref:Heterokaryon incompatibility domain-containing protein n=1 Tax=Magnaporthiopsis poae (strain ATCC 64411 / 73-15) TaxID=644358 RepID=A0A0C4DZI5_MAGP6|nr:hypothetical protein MAPG_05487 [Magnaporthiopsis poae ATCC 64411]
MLCDLCDGLSISCLFELAETEFSVSPYPETAYYRHHASLEDLLRSADSGCEFCQFLVACSKLTPVHLRDYRYMSEFDCFQKRKYVCDVRIALGTTYAQAEGLWDLKALDLISVQFGPLYQEIDMEFETKEEETEQLDMSGMPMPLAITVFPPDSQWIRLGENQICIGRLQIDPDQASEFNFDMILYWIDDCLENHESCPPQEPAELPTRLVCLGTEEDWSDLRLVQPPPGTKSIYLTLSHCWGGHIETILTKKNLDTFLKHIPFADLPRNFRDALVITRKLGGGYIWIDCLCIIQDSPEDWAREAGRMDDIYRNAFLTISAAASEGSKAGIFKRHSSFPGASPNPDDGADSTSPPAADQLPSCKMRVFPKSSSDNTMVLISPHIQKIDMFPKDPATQEQFSLTTCAELIEDMRAVQYESPLSRRAWTLQEEVLSPRRLMYGAKQIYWRCVCSVASADGCPGDGAVLLYGPMLHYLHNPKYQKQPAMMTRERRTALRKSYYMTVVMFVSRNITYPSDKLPAISGIAQICHPLFGGDYLAGIWSTDILYGLAWYVGREIGEESIARTGPYRAPTWSWASVDRRLYWATPEFGACECPGTTKMELLSYDVCLETPQNPYGQVTRASLRVRGYTRRLIRSRSHLWTGDVPSEWFTPESNWDDSADWAKYYKLVLDGEEVWLDLFEDELHGSNPVPNPEAEFLLLFLFAGDRYSHTCITGAGSDQAAAEEGSLAVGPDGEGPEGMSENENLKDEAAEVVVEKESSAESPDGKGLEGVNENEDLEEEAAEEVAEEAVSAGSLDGEGLESPNGGWSDGVRKNENSGDEVAEKLAEEDLPAEGPGGEGLEGVSENEASEEEAAEKEDEDTRLDLEFHFLILSRHLDAGPEAYTRVGYLYMYKGTWEDIYKFDKKELTLV